MGVNEVAGYYRSLEQGFRTLGLRAEFFNFFPHAFHYQDPQKERLSIKLIRLIRQRINEPSRTRRLNWVYTKQLERTVTQLFLFWAAWRFDVFIFGYRTGILWDAALGFTHQDLPLLKRWGKRIIYVFHGSDSRPPYLDGSYASMSPECLLSMTREAKSAIDNIGRYADYIIDHPPTSYFHERNFVQWLHIGIPCIDFGALNEAAASTELADGKRAAVRIVHAPSNPGPKGTERVRQVVRELVVEGWKIDYMELTHLPNADVIKNVRSADFVIDQVYSDTPMAGFATEAAWFGKPAIVCGQELNCVLAALPTASAPPSLCGTPDELKMLVISLMADPEGRAALGRKAQTFVREHWNAAAVAARYLRLLANDVPNAWWSDPSKSQYRLGYGLTVEQRDEIVGAVLKFGGYEGLCLSDKPGVEWNVSQVSLENRGLHPK